MSIQEQLDTHRAEREALLARAARMLEGHLYVVAAWLAGSLGRGDADELSDIDLWVVLNESHVEVVLAGYRRLVASVGDPLLFAESLQNAPAGGAYLLALYKGAAGPHQIDWYWQPRATARIPVGARVLFNGAGILAGDVPVARISAAEPSAPQKTEDRIKAVEQITFFWAMAPIAAKKIARSQPWAALGMISMLQHTLDEVKWLVGVGSERPGYEDRRATPPPQTQVEQLAQLREMCQEMEHLGRYLESTGSRTLPDTIAQVYRFLDLAEGLAKETEASAEGRERQG